MEKAHKMQEKKKSISGRKTDKTGKPAIWQLRGRGFYAGNEKEEKNLQSVILDMVNRFGYLGILILIAVENVFPPIPSEVILTFGGFLTNIGRNTVKNNRMHEIMHDMQKICLQFSNKCAKIHLNK